MFCANKVQKYKDCGVTSLTDHVKWKGHISKLLDAQINSVLAGVSEPLKTIYMYGTQPLFHNILSQSLSEPSDHLCI